MANVINTYAPLGVIMKNQKVVLGSHNRVVRMDDGALITALDDAFTINDGHSETPDVVDLISSAKSYRGKRSFADIAGHFDTLDTSVKDPQLFAQYGAIHEIKWQLDTMLNTVTTLLHGTYHIDLQTTDLQSLGDHGSDPIVRRYIIDVAVARYVLAKLF